MDEVSAPNTVLLEAKRSRQYQRKWGRFLSPDPLSNSTGENRYAFTGSRPLSLRDPTGLSWSFVFGDVNGNGAGDASGGILGDFADALLGEDVPTAGGDDSSLNGMEVASYTPNNSRPDPGVVPLGPSGQGEAAPATDPLGPSTPPPDDTQAPAEGEGPTITVAGQEYPGNRVFATLAGDPMRSFLDRANETLNKNVRRFGNVTMAVPPDVNVDDNLKIAAAHRPQSSDPILNAAETIATLNWFYNQVRNKAPWDYKQRNHILYQQFGNFNFGATGAAAGIPTEVLLRGAGWGQTRAGTSRPEFGKWYGRPPYGDDPDDQDLIWKGIIWSILRIF
jgi:RHS repeat-associated protein